MTFNPTCNVTKLLSKMKLVPLGVALHHLLESEDMSTLFLGIK